MRLKNTLRMAALLGASALTVTACTRKTDLYARFPEHMKHCFGEDCKFSYVRSEELSSFSTDNYRLEYKDCSGKTRVLEANRLSIVPYDSETDGAYCTEDAYYFGELEMLIQNELSDLFSEEFCEQVVRPLLPDSYFENSSVRFGKDGADGYIILSVGPLGSVNADDAETRAVGDEVLDAKTGIQLCKADLKSIVQDERLRCMLAMVITPDAESADYRAQFEQITAELRALGAQNLSAVLRDESLDGDGVIQTETVSREINILGQQVDYEERKAAWGGKDDYSVIQDMWQSLLQKRKGA